MVILQKNCIFVAKLRMRKRTLYIFSLWIATLSTLLSTVVTHHHHMGRIAVNESLDFLRKQKLADKVSADEDVSVASRLMSDEYFDGDEVQARLQEAVARLPEVQRTVFNLKYFEEMKYSEISQILNTSEGALKASYHLAVKKITEYLHLFD